MKLLRWSVVRYALAFAGVLAPIAVSTVAAQTQPRFHATLGIHARNHALDGIGPQQAIFEIAANIRTHTSRAAGITFGAIAGTSVQTPWSGDDLVCPIDSGGGCKPGLPESSYAGLQFGAEVRSRRFSASLATGPAAVHFESMTKVGGIDQSGRRLFPVLPATTVFGIHTRAEVAAYVAGHLGLVLSSTWRHLAQFRGAPYDVNGLGIGIRVQ